MGSDTTEHVLAQFGITSVLDSQGNSVRTINIVGAHPDCPSHRAYFDDRLSQWRLDEPSLNSKCLVEDQLRDAALTTRPAVPRNPPISRLAGTRWTDALPPSDFTDFFCSYDWAATSLGPCDTWPYTLRLYSHMLFSECRAGAIYWGEERIAIYNEHFLPLMGPLHPVLMGRQMERIIPPTFHFFDSKMRAIDRDQMGLAQRNVEVPTERHGYLEESWWDGVILPLKDDRGEPGGIWFSWVEVTRTVLRDRATALLNRLGQSSRIDGSHLWEHIYSTFAEYPRDIPMAIMYAADRSDSNSDRCCLQYTIGPSNAYTAAPATIDLATTDDPPALAPLFIRARKSASGFIVLDSSQDDLHPSITENVKWCGHGEPSKYLVVIAVRTKETIKGYLVLGLNSRRGFDPDHKQFLSDLVHQLRDLMTKIASEEEAQTRERRLVEALSETERRIRKIAQIAPVGIYELDVDGALLWANSHFFDILGVAHTDRDISTFDWKDYIHPEDLPKAQAAVIRLLADKVEASDSLRLIRHWRPPSSPHNFLQKDEPHWILFSASPGLDEDGSVRSQTGCITDISRLKWAEQLQIRTAEAAVRDKQRQEEFIDITSHELRNPLSAITQCADSIIASLHEVQNATIDSLVDVVKHNVEAAESIALCAAHQRRIINDVLALGKLDSGLLSIIPGAFHPQSLLEKAIQMFSEELATSRIKVTRVIDEASVLEPTSSAYGDAARIMQILVNLLTNAIKFTRTQEIRAITIRFRSSYSLPNADLFGPDFRWHEAEKKWPDLAQESTYGQERPTYLCYSVTDTGTGIASDSADRVFSKFEQADRRTYINYGGSGLGLYISKKLTEMQGGRIGVGTKEGVGSTFAFYTKARCAQNQISHVDAARRQNITMRVMEGTHRPGQKNKAIHERPDNGIQPSPPKRKQYQVLLVEDNIINQNVLAKQLKKAGCAVHLANHGGEAIDFVLQLVGQPAEYKTPPEHFVPRQIDCILMDWEMPVCNGITATERIREVEIQQGVVKKNIIIGITANVRQEQVLRAMEAGMDHVVSKPFRVPDLLLKIGDLVDPKPSEHQGVTQWSSS